MPSVQNIVAVTLAFILCSRCCALGISARAHCQEILQTCKIVKREFFVFYKHTYCSSDNRAFGCNFLEYEALVGNTVRRGIQNVRCPHFKPCCSHTVHTLSKHRFKLHLTYVDVSHNTLDWGRQPRYVASRLLIGEACEHTQDRCVQDSAKSELADQARRKRKWSTGTEAKEEDSQRFGGRKDQQENTVLTSPVSTLSSSHSAGTKDEVLRKSG